MGFDQNYYNYLLSTNPPAAAQYAAQFQPAAAPAAPAAPAQYAQPVAPVAPPAAPLQGQTAEPIPELARGTLEDFDDQRVGGGGVSVTKFYQGHPWGSWVHIRISRDLNNTDVHQQTDFKTKQPKTFRDGKPKFDLWVPVQVLGTSDPAWQAQVYSDKNVVAYLRPDSGDGLKSQVQRALAAIGNPDGLRTGKIGGVELVITSAGEKPNANAAATKLYNVQAFPAQEGAVDPTVAVQASAVPVPAPVPAAPTAPVPAAPTTPVTAASMQSVATAPAPAAPTQVVASPPTTTPLPPAPTTPSAPVAAPTEPAPTPVTSGGETKEQLLARLSGAGR